MKISESRGVVRVTLTRDELGEILDAATYGGPALFEEPSGQRSIEFHIAG